MKKLLIVIPKSPWGTKIDRLKDELELNDYEVITYYVGPKNYQTQIDECKKILKSSDILLMPQKYISDFFIDFYNTLFDEAIKQNVIFNQFNADWDDYDDEFARIYFDDDATKIIEKISAQIKDLEKK